MRIVLIARGHNYLASPPGGGLVAHSELLPGALVTSLAGRDRGALYVVVQSLGPDRVAVADGKVRRATRPKVKNTKHLALVSDSAAALQKRLQGRESLTDEELREIIQNSRV